LPLLDGVRGLAVLVVMVFHFRAPDLPKWAAAAVGVGWCGVDLFFVLSGFLITGILLETRERAGCLPVFWMRRVLRIFPLYLLALAVLLEFPPPGWGPPPGDRPYYWLYLNNWWFLLGNAEGNHVLGHFWSLAVEEQFYLLWPLAVWLLPPRWTLRAAVIGMAVAMGARALAVLSDVPAEAVYRGTLFRLDALLAGAACAVLVRSAEWGRLRAASWRGLVVSACGMAMTLALARSTHYQNEWIQLFGYAFLWCGAACLILQCAIAPGDWRWFGVGWLRTLGRYSYGLYVWHWPVAYLLLRNREAWLPEGWWGALAMQGVGFACAWALAWTSYRFIEEPILGLKRYFSLDRKRNQEGGCVFLSSSISAGTTSNRSPTMP
jgi:peptidoglycan/LPS O-acetylase OafA/YrhL